MKETSTEEEKSSIEPHHVGLLLLILVGLLAFHLRHRIKTASLKFIPRMFKECCRCRRLESFDADLEQGLTSNTFDISSNIANEDLRKGLDRKAKESIKEIMNKSGLSFDEARSQYTRSQLHANDIDHDGVPRDPKLITFADT
ncbi:uncharacterized protein PRCAT00000840001 [Priceomyces carsonii]|uniref:uncharacterized protein n=1 Tax=Priceomyces carsonii TaxID=28549 RepID=UPI002ED9090E|nr:unnamed protein product [Priceomyces carsonii]